MKNLLEYINENYGGNKTAFCKDAGFIKQKLNRLLKMDCKINVATGEIVRVELKHVCFGWVK